MLWQGLRSIWLQLYAARGAWIAFIVDVLFVAWSFWGCWPRDSELRIRVCGMLLQLGGVLSVAVGVDQTRRQLGKTPLWNGIRNYFSNLLSRPKSIALMAGTGSMRATGQGALSSVEQATTPSSLEDRLTNAEAELRALSGRIDQLHTDVLNETHAREQVVTAERNARVAAEGQLRRLLEEVQTGGVVLAVAGLGWILVGIILSSIPDVLARFAG